MGILEKMSLKGKKALVTGGARGIGKCIAFALAEAGADVAVVDLDLAEAQKASNEIGGATSAKTIAIRADITSASDMDVMIAAVLDKFGRLDIAFCNAGITNECAVEDDTYDAWRKIIEVNLNGTFLSAQAAGKVMLKQGSGSIILTGSMSGCIINIPQREASYAVSKAGVIHMARAMAIEWATRGVRVNCISPGYMATEMTLNTPSLAPLIDQWNELSPMRRMGTPEELQSIAVYLAGDTSTFTTGANFIIDGAYTCF
jgi:NAD(P)-dependent dehydrogenase (short-subunit alcohol dehydrogenase family)